MRMNGQLIQFQWMSQRERATVEKKIHENSMVFLLRIQVPIKFGCELIRLSNVLPSFSLSRFVRFHGRLSLAASSTELLLSPDWHWLDFEKKFLVCSSDILRVRLWFTGANQGNFPSTVVLSEGWDAKRNINRHPVVWRGNQTNKRPLPNKINDVDGVLH